MNNKPDSLWKFLRNVALSLVVGMILATLAIWLHGWVQSLTPAP